MGYQNPPTPWRELERRLSGRPEPEEGREAPVSRKKKRVAPLDVAAPAGPVTPYAELHCHSHFSFLDGAGGPDALAQDAVRLGLHALALTDHDGLYGAPLLDETAQRLTEEGHPMRTVYGAELSLGSRYAASSLGGYSTSEQAPSRQGVPDPPGTHLLVLARGVEGYHRLAAAITDAHLRGGEKGRPVYDLDELAARAEGHWLVLTGCRKGAVRTALAGDGPAAAAAELTRLTDLFGADNVAVELIDHGLPTDSTHNDLLAGVAAEQQLPVVATNNVHHASPATQPDGHRVAGTMAAIRARRSLADLAGWLPPTGWAALTSGAEMARRFERYPGAVAHSVVLADECAFDLRKATPRLPKQGIPSGHTPTSWLKVLVERGFAERYAGGPLERQARERVDHEVGVIEAKDFAGYFVIVHDIVAFATSQGILCQGRGSAAASAVCYALGITSIDPVFYRLPFERFISTHRDEEPDIDVDFDSDRREEVIQWVYDRYGRHNAAQVSNVISYRPKLAIRDAAKALGYSVGQQDAWSKQVSSWSRVEVSPVDDSEGEVPQPVLRLAGELLGAPRHLGIHSGGMVLTERPIGEVCPIEPARMEKRTVLQWDKDAAEYMGLVKFDLLGLGMLSALDAMMRIVAERLGEEWELRSIPREEPAVYDMLCRADSVGVFQVESRAQIGTLPRLRPRSFYDLAIEIALIRPGPIQGGAVHPYIRRVTGEEPITYAHPLLEPVLERTAGVPLFQEQLMEMAKVLGDCTAEEADLLRRAMGSKRGVERIESISAQLFRGMADKGITGAEAEALYAQILSFANFGFAESHSLSFAVLVYASSWFKLHYPGAFLAGLLRAQPMGFYSPQSLTADARRHGVRVLPPDLQRSGIRADLEPVVPDKSAPSAGGRGANSSGTTRLTGLDSCLADGAPTAWVPGTPDPTPVHRRDTDYAVRLGLDSVRGVGTEVAERIVAAREERPYADPPDLSRRAGLDAGQMEALATAGVLSSGAFGQLSRRQALWQAGWTESADQLPGVGGGAPAPTLPEMDETETLLADLSATGITTSDHPIGLLRPRLDAAGIRSVAALAEIEPGRRVHVAGLITHRQRPGTAGGVTFLNLEDESGMLNIICTAGLWKRYRTVAVRSSGMVIRGVLERHEGATNLLADRLTALEELFASAGQALAARHRSRDFR